MSGGSRSRFQDHFRLVRGHARRRLVEQQHLRPQPERDRDLHQALLAVGQVGDARRGVVGEAERLEQAPSLSSMISL